ncbi:MAG: mechanosensitive ion channel family protein [Syntrophobacterales bacterium]|nr:mechanosensitive ion channel family protein [Syntrophobacterales bacterium]
MRFKRQIFRFTVITVLCLLSSGLLAQTTPFVSKKNLPLPVPEEVVTDNLGRMTPQGTIVNFMMAAQKGNDERALKFLNTKKTGRNGYKLVNQLQVVLERGFSGRLGMLSTKNEGHQNDHLLPSKEFVGSVKSESGSLDIFLEKIQQGNQPPVWLFASETLDKIPEFYEELNLHSPEKYIPQFMTDIWFLWFPLWQWIYILLVVPFSFMIATFLTRLLAPLLIAIVFRITRYQAHHHVMALTRPLRIFILALAMWAISIFSRSILVSLFWSYAALTLVIVGITWLTIRLIDITVNLRHTRWAGTASGKIAMIELAGKLSKAFILIAGTLAILRIAGINITAALTGLGIGGIAVAFAAQKALENLFGGIMIISDQPIRVGDSCKAGTYSGTVESIGMRSTCIRTSDRTIVAIPNGQLALMSLENFTLRDKILLQHKISLHPNTTSKQLESVLHEIRNVLKEHPKIETDTARVNFVRFSEFALELELNAYVQETAYETFTTIQEELLIAIMNIIEASGTHITLPAPVAPNP